ncbi:MAG: hypothetical protein ACYDCN_14505 [Bacteroidia bacterium]
METNNTITDLENKEKEVYKELQNSTLFKQWESLKTTIQLFKKSDSVFVPIKSDENIPTEYNTDLTWAEKVLFALNRINEGFPEDITNEILKFETETDKEDVFKRVRGKTYMLLNNKKIRIVKKVGRKMVLAIK